FATHIKVYHSHVYKINPSIGLDVAALTEPLAVAVHAVERSKLKLGDNILIMGGGPIGLMIASVSRLTGIENIIISETSEYRLNIIRAIGFVAIDANKQSVPSEINKKTNGMGVAIVYEAAATKITSVQMTNVIKKRGTAVIVGLIRDLVPVSLGEVNLKELNIVGTMVYSDQNFCTALSLLPKITKLKKLISHNIPLEEYSEGFEDAINKKSMKVLLKP